MFLRPHEYQCKLLLRYWLSMAIWDMWEDVRAPANVVNVNAEGYKPARRYYSLLGVILQRFVDVVQSGAGIKTCGHPLCRREFVASRSNQLHCTDDCTQAHKQKRLRDDLRKSTAG